VAGTVFVSLVILLMTRYDWYAREMDSHVLHIQVHDDAHFERLFDKTLAKYTRSSELISADSAQNGTMTELTYSVGLKRSTHVQELLAEIRSLNGNNRVTLIAGYSGSDL
jgi:hypothetical protein